MTSAWKKLWSDCLSEHDFEPASVVNENVSLDKSMGVEGNGDFVEELADGHKTELTIEL